MSFVITFYGKCRRRHVVGQQVVTLAHFVVEVFVSCVLKVNLITNLLLCLLVAVYLERLFFFTYTKDVLPHNMAMYLVTTYREFSDAIAPYLYDLSNRVIADDLE